MQLKTNKLLKKQIAINCSFKLCLQQWFFYVTMRLQNQRRQHETRSGGFAKRGQKHII